MSKQGAPLITDEYFNSLVPKTFTIETALACNLKCPECAIGGEMIGRAKNLMRLDKFKIIAEKIQPFAEYVYLHLWGEPLLNKQIFEMIKITSQFAKTNISTNALLLDREKAERLITSGVSDIIVSIDGFTQEVYEKYRVGGNVIDALERLVWLQEFNIKNGRRVSLSPQFIVFKHNQHEVPQFRDFCRSIGLEPAFKAPYIRNESSTFEKPDFTELHRKEYDSIATLRSAMSHCDNPRSVFTLLSDGSAVVCCHDFDRFTYFGNIFEQDVMGIWNSPEYREYRWDILNKKAPRFCLEKCMTFVPSKKCADEIKETFGSEPLAKITPKPKDDLVGIGAKKKDRPVPAPAPLAAEGTPSPAKIIEDVTKVKDAGAPDALPANQSTLSAARTVNPELVAKIPSEELRTLGERLVKIEQEISKISEAVSKPGNLRASLEIIESDTRLEEERSRMDYNQRLQRVVRAPVRATLSNDQEANTALERARSAFKLGKHLEGIDLFEQLIETLPQYAIPLAAELYDLYMGLATRRNRYHLYVSRHFDFKIKPGDKVLDIGSGHDPFPHATHLADIAENDNSYGRAGAALKKVAGLPFFECNVESMPFKDKEFDFVYCSHVLEHTVDPEKACSELMRVAKRGYIETPTKGKDQWLNSARISNHHWTVENWYGKLIFTEYSREDLVGLGCDILMNMHCAPETQREKAFSALVWLKARLANTMFYWEDEFDFEVRNQTADRGHLNYVAPLVSSGSPKII